VQIRSDINYRIERLFRERGIKIPYPTQEFLVKNMDLHPAGEPDLLAQDKASEEVRTPPEKSPMRKSED